MHNVWYIYVCKYIGRCLLTTMGVGNERSQELMIALMRTTHFYEEGKREIETKMWRERERKKEAMRQRKRGRERNKEAMGEGK